MGFTDPNDETPSAVLMRERRDELKSAMRRYVLVVMAHVDSDDPADAVLADSLLLPIKTWKPRTPAVPATGEPGETPPATEPPAADPPATPAG